jgi:hypothetical protein
VGSYPHPELSPPLGGAAEKVESAI